MNRKLWKLLGITAVTLTVAGAALAATALPPPGTICTKFAKMRHFVVRGTTGVLALTNGSITAKVGQPIQGPTGGTGFNFSVLDFQSQGSVTGLGAVSLTLDTSRTPAPSTFIANSTGQDNTQRINVFLNVDINGTRYRSASQVTLLSTSVAAFPPPSGTVYDLTTKVQLLDSAGRVVYELPVGQAATIL